MSVYFLAVGEVFRENVEGPHSGSRSKRPIHTEPVVLIVQDVSVNKMLKNRQSLHFNEKKLQTPVQRTTLLKWSLFLLGKKFIKIVESLLRLNNCLFQFFNAITNLICILTGGL